MVAILLAALAGLCGVLQGGINRHIAQQWGFSSALLFNGVVFLIFNLFLFAFVYFKPGLVSETYRLQGEWGDVRWWWMFPGLFGLILVGSIATSINQIGALQAFVFCVGAQLIASNLWDYIIEGKDLSLSRLGGTAVTCLGVWIASR